MTKKPKETIGGKEICGAIFCLLVVLICLFEEISKKGYLVERKGNFISANAFLYFNSNFCKRLTNNLPLGKEITKMQENLVKLCYTAQKVQLSASILILIYVLIINQGGGID